MDLISILIGLALSVTGLVSFIHVNLVLEFTKHLPLADVGLFAVVLTFARLPFEILAFTAFGGFNELTSISKTSAQVQNFKTLLKQSLLACAFAILLFPASTFVLPLIWGEIKQYTALITGFLFLVISFKYFKKNALETLVVIGLASACGILALNSLSSDGLFPLLTGLYAIPALVIAGNEVTRKKEEKFDAKISLAGALAALFSSLLPAVGPALVAIIASGFFSIETLAFQSLVFSIYASRTVFDFTNIYTIQKARSSAATLLPVNISYDQILLLVLAAFVCLLVTGFIASWISGKVKLNLENFKTKIAITGLIVVAVILQTESFGLLVLLTSGAVGIYAAKCDNRLLLGVSLIAPLLALVF